MKRTIGIVGGISPASTLEYYRSITSMYYERNRDYYYPEIVIKSINLGFYLDLEKDGKHEEFASYISGAVESLAAGGAEFGILASNSSHSVFEEVSARSPIPLISIVDVTAGEALRLGLKKTLLTGIKLTMAGTFYQTGFSRVGLEMIVPSQEHQDEIDRIISEELVLGRFDRTSRTRFLDITSAYDVDGVVLGCTELPLLVGEPPTGRPFLDTLHLHAEAALKHSLS